MPPAPPCLPCVLTFSGSRHRKGNWDLEGRDLRAGESELKQVSKLTM